ncbi:MAG: GNAT family N-acetyltransferase [Leptolyngbya sp. SIOISBB]|nr:GNAT family N-acetyltransferase [Leptolyngbya sp. SIOISBB]
MSTVTIRPANLEDAAGLAHLAEYTFRDTFATNNNLTDMELHCAENFGVDVQRQELLDDNSVTLLAETADQLVAFAQVWLCSPKACVTAQHSSELHRLYVTQEWQGRGVAHELMSRSLSIAAKAGADAIWLGVWEENPRAIAFYRKYGFQAVGEHVFQFGNDPQRDLVMMTAIDESWIA